MRPFNHFDSALDLLSETRHKNIRTGQVIMISALMRKHYSVTRGINDSKTYTLFFSSHGATAPSGPGPPHYRSFTITPRHTHTLGRIPLDEWSARRRDRDLTDNVQHSQGTDVHVLSGIRTHNPSKGAVTNPRLRPRSHWIDTYFLYQNRDRNFTSQKVSTSESSCTLSEYGNILIF
jgi:hypothetical protein